MKYLEFTLHKVILNSFLGPYKFFFFLNLNYLQFEKLGERYNLKPKPLH